MPLHLIPESTTLVKAPYFINELTLIEAVSKSLPIGWFLYVKEHQSMLGERSIEYLHNTTSEYTSESILISLSKIKRIILRYISIRFLANNSKLVNTKHMINVNEFRNVIFQIKTILKRRNLMKTIKIFDTPK